MKTLKKQFTKILPLLLAILFFTACSENDPSGSLKGELLVTGIWDDGKYIWVFRPERKLDAFLINEDKETNYVNIDKEHANVPYSYDLENQLLYYTMGGHTTAANVLELTSKKMVLKEGKEIIDFTKVSDKTNGYAPESVAGKKLAIGLGEQNILFNSNSSCSIILNWSGVYLNTEINRPPSYSYKKINDTTAELTYVYGDITPLLSWITIETVYRCTLTLHFTAGNIGYVTGNMLTDSVEHDAHTNDDEASSKSYNWDNIPFILQ